MTYVRFTAEIDARAAKPYYDTALVYLDYENHWALALPSNHEIMGFETPEAARAYARMHGGNVFYSGVDYSWVVISRKRGT